jgi:hypothetical protein
MPRPYIRRKSRGSREAELPEQIRAFLFDEEPPEDRDPLLNLGLLDF